MKIIISSLLLIFFIGCANKNLEIKNNNQKTVLINNRIYIPYKVYKIKQQQYIILNKFFINNYLNYLSKIKLDIFKKDINLYFCNYYNLYPFYIVNNKKVFFDKIKNNCFVIKKNKFFKYILKNNVNVYFISDKFKKFKTFNIFIKILKQKN